MRFASRLLLLGALPPNPRDLSLFSARMDVSMRDFKGTDRARPLAFPAAEPVLGIAVGMTIADHPPHRSVLAELPHTAPPLDTSVEALIGIGMKSTGTRDPSIKDRPQLFPIGLPPLTTTT